MLRSAAEYFKGEQQREPAAPVPTMAVDSELLGRSPDHYGHLDYRSI